MAPTFEPEFKQCLKHILFPLYAMLPFIRQKIFGLDLEVLIGVGLMAKVQGTLLHWKQLCAKAQGVKEHVAFRARL